MRQATAYPATRGDRSKYQTASKYYARFHDQIDAKFNECMPGTDLPYEYFLYLAVLY